jgi:hypothetical protein
MTWQDQPRCPRCKRWAYPGQRHVCAGELRRCANPRCRRLLPVFPRGGDCCIRCAALLALAQAGSGRPGLPANTGRPRRWRFPAATVSPAPSRSSAAPRPGPSRLEPGQGSRPGPLARARDRLTAAMRGLR